MVSLSTLILCISIAFFALTVQESSAGTHRYKLPGKNVTHTHQYKKPGTTNVHTYQYKNPGTTNTHHYQYKEPGTVNTHTYRYKNSGPPHRPVTGVYSIINTIYNYFAVGGKLTGMPPLDLVLLRYYNAQGPRSFCPKN